ncbi:uncharacterized protein HD556DRAFT_1311709 [Suillus plorans]|uniref:Uncharacterized protein n=1 Tax=Suillus plorans TaxID=116603 RepID=A0A9P7DCV6_9AGAM|nr:uncharacterized protein HD556DRAFT_1311709 [Suillus plorans]KAG1788961.1 hypothetical protein HD556DRAFT_1311709 [Suillus plorans]
MYKFSDLPPPNSLCLTHSPGVTRIRYSNPTPAQLRFGYDTDVCTPPKASKLDINVATAQDSRRRRRPLERSGATEKHPSSQFHSTRADWAILSESGGYQCGNAAASRPVQPRNGSWNVIDQIFHEPKSLSSWGILNYSRLLIVVWQIYPHLQQVNHVLARRLW